MYKYTIYYVALLAFVAMPMFASAAYNDVSLATDTTIAVGSYNLTVSGSAASIESIVVNSTDFVATVSSGSSLVVKSADGYVMTVSGVGGNDYSQECLSTTNNRLTISISSGSTRSVKVTPTSTVCEVPSVSSSGSRSGGGGGGGYTYTAPVATPAISPATTPAVASICPAGLVCTPKSSVPSVSVVFTNDLSRGMTNSDVSKLQQILAADSAIYPEGQVTGYFGPATERAVKKFQAKYGIDQLGRVGPATRAKLNSLSTGNTPATASAPTTQAPASIGISATFTVNMSKGDSSNDVMRLQQLLNKDVDTQIATEGVGSLGNETTSFGSLTEKAVQRFQVKYNIANEGDSGYGTVGPKTRAKLNELGR